RELLLGVDDVGQRTAEVLSEGLIEARLAASVVLVDLLQFFEAEILRLAGSSAIMSSRRCSESSDDDTSG
ncbi:MAG: hypothetical protein OXI48_03475, partial [bacterium]|nr:hypothetical protein [bacterium]